MKYHLLGINISVLVHAAMIALIFFVSHGFSTQSRTLVLDISIIKSTSGAQGSQPKKEGATGSRAASRPTAPMPGVARQVLKQEAVSKKVVPKKTPPPVKKPNTQPRLEKRPPVKPPVQKAKPRPARPVKPPESIIPPKIPPIQPVARAISPEVLEPTSPVQENIAGISSKPVQSMEDPVEVENLFPPDTSSDLSNYVPVQRNHEGTVATFGKERMAQDEQGSAAAVQIDGGGEAGGGGGLSLAVYYNSIRGRLRDSLLYPQIARKMGYSGKVIVSFTVYPDGTVEDIKIKKSCGVSILDKSALKTVKKACPFPRPTQIAKIVIPIVYRLN